MKIERGNALAEAVLLELRKLLVGETRLHGFVSGYKNGRENGLIFTVCGKLNEAFVDRSFTFSEYRNSDDIVVYDGDFQSILTFGPEKAGNAMYDAKKFFRTPKAAAQHIAKEVLVTIRMATKKKVAV